MQLTNISKLIMTKYIFCRNRVRCNIPNCNQEFDTLFVYESHYNSLHRFLCAQCSKNLPSAHLLDLHLSETHDSFFAVQAERKPMVRFLHTYIPISPNQMTESEFVVTIFFPVSLLFGRMLEIEPKCIRTSRSLHHGT